ncbi:hypothetical protein diail_3318 [Diaporthe ilicicola]|nr:hypothetical protein diail_3318 [Diaporthe ilicicola]
MPDSYDVAMFSAALEKKTHLLPKSGRKEVNKNEPKSKAAMGSEVTLVETSSTSQPQKESTGAKTNESIV